MGRSFSIPTGDLPTFRTSYFGTDHFTYHVSDGLADSNVANVTLFVNDFAPTTENSSYSVQRDKILSVDAPGLLANATDMDGDPLTPVLGQDVAHGTVTLNGDGSFTYTPETGYYGPDSFTYTISDGLATSSPATVSISVLDAPQLDIQDSFGVGWEGGTLSFFLTATTHYGNVATYDVDVDGDGNYDVTGTHDPQIDGALLLDVLPVTAIGSTVDNGTYTGHVRVTADTGFYTLADISITIGNVPGTISPSGTDDTPPGSPFVLTVGSTDPGPDTVSSLTIDWGDGATDTPSATSGDFSHVYAATGEYTITVTLTDEDGSNSQDLIVEIGDTNAPMPIDHRPQITSAVAVILNNGDAELTVNAVDEYNSPNVSYEWDLDGDGEFDDATGPVVQLSAGAGVNPYSASVRITDTNGNVNEGLFAFLGAGDVEPQATKGTYRANFLQATPNMPAGWQVHHIYPQGGQESQILAKRYLNELGINVHDNQYLRGADPTVHGRITAEQNAWWSAKAKSLGLGDDVVQAKKIASMADVKAFDDALYARYSDLLLDAGASKKAVAKIKSAIPKELPTLTMSKMSFLKSVGVVFAGIEFFDLLTGNAQAAEAIAKHTPAQDGAFNTFVQNYETAIDDAITFNRLSYNKAAQVKEGFIAYLQALGLNEGAVNNISRLMEIALSKIPNT
jgi:hypothetical protein